MKNFKIKTEEERIVRLIDKGKSFSSSGDFEGLSEWSKYICVVVAGYVENFVKELYICYANENTSRPIAKFVESHLTSLRNPKSEKIVELTGRFKSAWKIDIENFLSDRGRGEAIDSIMNQRHLIAHGKSKDSQVTLAKVSQYFDRIREVAEFIESICQNNSSVN